MVQCAEGLVCDPNGGVCRTPPQKNDECSIVSDSAIACDPDPALDLFCAGTGSTGRGTCAVAGKMGEACAGAGLPPCTGGLTCNQGGERGLGVCGPPPKAGSPCSLDNACESPARCAGSTGLCTMPGAKAVGEPCNAATDCASLDCSSADGGVCQFSQTRLVTCSGANVNAGATMIQPTFPGRDGGAFDAPGAFDAFRGEDAPTTPGGDGGAHE
jgi:hypothetical protein